MELAEKVKKLAWSFYQAKRVIAMAATIKFGDYF